MDPLIVRGGETARLAGPARVRSRRAHAPILMVAMVAAGLGLSCSGALSPPPGRSFGSEWLILATPLDTTQVHLGDSRDLEGTRSFPQCYLMSGASLRREPSWSQVAFSWNRATDDTSNLQLARALDRGASFSEASRGSIILVDPSVALAGDVMPRICLYPDRNGLPRLPAVTGLIGVTIFRFVSDGLAAKDIQAFSHGSGYASGSVAGDTVEFVFSRPRWIGARYAGFTAAEDDTVARAAAPGEWVEFPGGFQVACTPTQEKVPHGTTRYHIDWARGAADSARSVRGHAQLAIGEWVAIGADSAGAMRGGFAEVTVEPGSGHAVAIVLRRHHLVRHAFDSESSRRALREWIDR